MHHKQPGGGLFEKRVKVTCKHSLAYARAWRILSFCCLQQVLGQSPWKPRTTVSENPGMLARNLGMLWSVTASVLQPSAPYQALQMVLSTTSLLPTVFLHQ